MTTRFGCLILGDGVAGWTASVILAQAGLSVGLVRRNRVRAGARIGEYLPPEGVMVLEALGIGDLLENPAHRLSPGVVSIWGGSEPVYSPVLGRPGGRAYCLDRCRLHDDLANRGLELGVVPLIASGGPHLSESAWSVETAIGPVKGAYLIDATGRAAAGARLAKAVIERRDNLVALARVFEGRTSSDARLVIESLADGWAYSAPLTGDRQVAVILTDTDLLPRGRQCLERYFEKQLEITKIIFRRLGEVEPGPVLGLAAWSQLTTPSAGPLWAAIGDAAMAYDPVGSAGLTKAFRDVSEVTRLILEGDTTRASSLLKGRQSRFKAYERSLAEAYGADLRFNTPFWTRRHNVSASRGVVS